MSLRNPAILSDRLGKNKFFLTNLRIWVRATAIDSDVTVTVRTRPTRNRKKLGRKKRNGPREARPIFSREKEAEWAARSAAEVF